MDRNRKIFIVAVIKATELVAFITRKNWDLGSIFSQEIPKKGATGVRLQWKFFCFYSLFVCPIKETFPSSIVEWDSHLRSCCRPLLHSEKSNYFTYPYKFLSKWERLFSIAGVISAIMADITGKIETLGSIFSQETAKLATGVQCYF